MVARCSCRPSHSSARAFSSSRHLEIENVLRKSGLFCKTRARYLLVKEYCYTPFVTYRDLQYQIRLDNFHRGLSNYSEFAEISKVVEWVVPLRTLDSKETERVDYCLKVV